MLWQGKTVNKPMSSTDGVMSITQRAFYGVTDKIEGRSCVRYFARSRNGIGDGRKKCFGRVKV